MPGLHTGLTPCLCHLGAGGLETHPPSQPVRTAQSPEVRSSSEGLVPVGLATLHSQRQSGPQVRPGAADEKGPLAASPRSMDLCTLNGCQGAAWLCVQVPPTKEPTPGSPWPTHKGGKTTSRCRGTGVAENGLLLILLHQWLENFYLISANIGNRKMNSAEFHK